MTLADASEPEAAPVAVRLHHVSKSFPGVQALRDICFDLLAGEVHGLVGANGACKSAMIRMLSGASTPDSGEIEVGGAPLLNDDPRHLRAAGISAIYQELTIIPEMTALSNAFLGAAPSRWGFTDLGRMRARYAELSSWMGVAIDPGVKAGALPIASQQMLEIMRAVLADGSVLIMDEPTALPCTQVLPPTRAELDAGKWTVLGFPTNTLIPAQTWMPSICLPAGFSPDGLPVGMEIVVPPYHEPDLFRLGHAFERATGYRRPPATAL